MMICTFLIKHVRIHSPEFLTFPPSLGKCASYIGCGTVLVVGQCINDDRDTARTISFISNVLRS